MSHATLRELLATTPADSLPQALQLIEADRTSPSASADAALILGHLRFARAEYGPAATAFGRAAARLEPARKAEARYWAALSYLALGDPVKARASLEEVVRAGGVRRADAWVAIAQAWDLSDRPERAFEALGQALEPDAGEVGPAALERFASLSERMGHPDQARRARERLIETYPRSIEAAAARLAIATTQPGGPGQGAVAVVIGTFIDKSRARSLASEAKRAGFPEAQVVSHGQGLAETHTVQLGVFPRRQQAVEAGEQAAKALGVAYQVVKAP